MEEKQKKEKIEFDEQAFAEAIQKREGIRIERLRNRSNRCICRFCGGKLSMRKITYAAYDEAKIEMYCSHCDRMEYGVEPIIYKMAEYYAEEIQFDYYPEMDESESKHRMNISTLCDIMNWALKNTGLLEESGFTVPIGVNPEILGEASIYSRDELKDELSRG